MLDFRYDLLPAVGSVGVFHVTLAPRHLNPYRTLTSRGVCIIRSASILRLSFEFVHPRQFDSDVSACRLFENGIVNIGPRLILTKDNIDQHDF